MFSPLRRAKFPSPIGLPTITACLPSCAVTVISAPGCAGLSRILDPDDRIIRRIRRLLLHDLRIAERDQQFAQFRNVGRIVAAFEHRPFPGGLVHGHGRRRAALAHAERRDGTDLRCQRGQQECAVHFARDVAPGSSDTARRI